MIEIIKSKEYIAKCFKIGATYKIFIAEHSDGLFHSGVLYTTAKPITDEITIVDWHLKSFVDYKEEIVFNEAVKWIKDNLDPEPEITEIS